MNKNIIFKTKDSVHFFNKKNDINFSVYEVFDNDLDKKHYLKLNDTKWFYIFKIKGNKFYLRNVINISFNEDYISNHYQPTKIKIDHKQAC